MVGYFVVEDVPLRAPEMCRVSLEGTEKVFKGTRMRPHHQPASTPQGKHHQGTGVFGAKIAKPVAGVGPMGLNGGIHVDFTGVGRILSVPGLVRIRGGSCR